MKGNPQAALGKVLELTRRMLEAADDGDWDEVLRTEQVRREPFARLAAQCGQGAPAPALAPGLREILDAEERIRSLAGRRRQELATALGSLAMQRRLADEYAAP